MHVRQQLHAAQLLNMLTFSPILSERPGTPQLVQSQLFLVLLNLSVDPVFGSGFPLCSSSWGWPSAFLQHLCHEVRPEDNSEGGGSCGHPAQQAGQPDPLVPPGQVPGSWRPQGTALPQPCPAPALPCPSLALLQPCPALPPLVSWTPAYPASPNPALLCLLWLKA